jgi:hypothetical protein
MEEITVLFRWRTQDPRVRAERPLSKIIARSVAEVICRYETSNEHPFGTLKMRMGGSVLDVVKRLPKVATEMACT